MNRPIKRHWDYIVNSFGQLGREFANQRVYLRDALSSENQANINKGNELAKELKILEFVMNKKDIIQTIDDITGQIND